MTTGAAVLQALYQAAGQFVRGAEIARHGKRLAKEVPAAVAELLALGYTIESHPHLGYRLLGSPDRLMADDLLARLAAADDRRRSGGKPASAAARVAGSEILVFEETASTNDVVESLARSGSREGLAVFAESQTRGRGRQGRHWASPRGKGLWFSVLLRPKLAADAMSRLTVAASVAVAQAVRQQSGMDARIKWPNDVTVGDRKLAGILTEMRGDKMGGGAVAVLGIGLDVNCQRADFPVGVAAVATSLHLETGRVHDRAALAVALLLMLDEWYRAALTDFGRVTDEWARLSTTLGRQLVVTIGARRIEGHAQALDGDGALLLRKDNGQVERITGGDVVVEK